LWSRWDRKKPKWRITWVWSRL